MKFLDKLLRAWRVKVAIREMPDKIVNIFDIGCNDGYFLRQMAGKTIRQDGCDPRLTSTQINSNSRLLKGFFPNVIEENEVNDTYDVISGLAVFEHFSEEDLQKSATVLAKMLSPQGLIIITIPHPFVDKILDILFLLRLVDAGIIDGHHAFSPDDIIKYFSPHLSLVKKRKFQFGLNNIFVFRKG